jgi:hypothetical protein
MVYPLPKKRNKHKWRDWLQDIGLVILICLELALIWWLA